MNRTYKLLLIALLLVAGVSTFSCRTGQKGKGNHSAEKNLTQEQQLQNTALFIDAMREKFLGNYEKSLGLFAQCVKQNPANHGALYEMGMLLYQLKKDADAEVLLEGAVDLCPDNKWYWLLLADIYKARHRYDDAVEVYRHMTSQFPDNEEYYFDWADILLLQGKGADAIKIYDLYQKKYGIHPEISLQKEKIYVRLGKVNKAIDEIEALIKAFPTESSYYGILAELYMAEGMPLKAFELYQLILKINPADPLVHLSLADYYKAQNEPEKTFAELRLAFANRELDIDTKVKILLNLMQGSEKNTLYRAEIEELGRILTEAEPAEAKSFSIYGDILYRDGKKSQARDAFRAVIGLDSSRFVVWQQLLQLERDLFDFPALYNESGRALELFPEQAELYYFRGVAAHRLEKFTEAIAALRDGKIYVMADDSLLVKFHVLLADSYFRTGSYDQCFEAYEKGLKADPDNLLLLNEYSFSLALRKTNLTAAIQMADKLNRLSPGNPVYQDTYAWVLFAAGKMNDARAWAEKALATGGNSDFIILEHYGDILFHCGMQQEATDYWKKAKQAGGSGAILDRKINDRTFYDAP